MTGKTFGGDSGGTYGGETGGTYGTSVSPPRDITWLIGRSRVDALMAPHPDVTIGETSRFNVRFESGGVGNHISRYEQLRDRIMYASDTVTTGATYNGRPWFRERHSRETLVVKVEPGPDVQAVSRGVWGIIEGGSDRTDLAQVAAKLTVDIFVLAELDEYETREAVVRDLER